MIGTQTITQTILLMIADAGRRAQCFAALTDRPQRIVRGFAKVDDAIEALDAGDAGCLIIDQRGIGADALQSLLREVADHPAMVTLLLTDALSPADALALVRAAPSDILPQAVACRDLAARIDQLMPLAIDRRARFRDQMAAEHALARLSPREHMVLSALAEGQTSKDIARQLGVSPRTIEVHRASIMRRTGTETLAGLLHLFFLVKYGAMPPQSLAS